MQVVQESHQFSSPVTNWKSRNRRKQHYLNVNSIGSKIQKRDSLKLKSSKSVKSQQNPKNIPERSQSFKCPPSKKVSPSATSNPITIPSNNKKVKFVENEKSLVKDNDFSNTSFTLSSSFSAPKFATLDHAPRKADTSFNGIYRNISVKESFKEKKINLPKINTSNLTKILENKMNSYDTSFEMNKRSPTGTKSHEFTCSSASTLCQSPSFASISLSQGTANLSQEIESCSYTTLCNSPEADCSQFYSMSNDQLFKLLPKKIIKAIDDYKAQSTTEISYEKGDFFFVVSENESYYFVTNPSTKSSGYVLKYSFEQVDNFAKPNPNKILTGLSPIVEKEDSILLKESDPLSDRVMTASITEDIISRNSQNAFPIEISKIDGTVAVLNRSYNDICQLHHALLENFPEDSGSEDQERILPFLPSHDAIFNHPKKSPRQILNTYLQLLTQLPNDIQFSYPFEHFFNIRKDDILSSIYVVSQLNFFETEKEQEEQTVKVKVIVENKESVKNEIQIIRVSPKIKYFDLFDDLEERFQCTFVNFYFCNENNEKVKVFGDRDLKLFFNSNSLSYVLYAK
ncbi:hypothetical protein BCR36DRAFT_412025 [Piromyces finnis]|uniref:SH3 domain-containing protein n=1 Tax=Piromyces finnis TaxID=1754191 RepID=A0A1Y1VBF0_9FUNG|nr:hypothetical protein BCR36DRAFT_412025 [Piromyces finnis]|eukprot:ORX51043.1 hypothetical protein BCR36DRAFT_412025 [Piromyces finnis]